MGNEHPVYEPDVSCNHRTRNPGANRLKFRLLYAATIMSVAGVLAGCGGGDSGSGSGTSTPAPTPTPTSAPSATPTPTPVSAYVVPDYTTDFSLTTSLGYTVNLFTYPTELNAAGVEKRYYAGGQLLDAMRQAKLVYRHSPESVEFNYDGSALSFSAAERIQGSIVAFAKRRTDGSFLELMLLSPTAFVRVPKYVVPAFLQSTRNALTSSTGAIGAGYQLSGGLFGTPTVTADPLPDFLGYEGTAVIYGGIPGSKSQSIDQIGGVGGHLTNWAYTPSDDRLTGSIPLIINLNSIETPAASLTAKGRFDRVTNAISGTLTDSVNGYTGTFRGQVFGPGRAELGIVFEFSRASDGAKYFGHFIGTR